MKRMEELENRDLTTCLKDSKITIVNHLLEKLGKVEDEMTGYNEEVKQVEAKEPEFENFSPDLPQFEVWLI